MIKKVSYCLLFGVLLFSCSEKNNEITNDNVVVGLNGEYIYKKDIVKILPKDVSSEDSMIIIDNYIDNWLTDRLIYEEAVKMVQDTSVIVEKVENYRRQLYIHYYIENIVNSEINYKVSEEEINNYYNNHLDEYVLATTYVKGHYLTMDSKIHTYYDVLDKIRNSTLEDEEMLKDYCIGTTRRVYFVKDWTTLGQFLGIVKYSDNISVYDLPYISVLDYVVGELRYIVKIDEYAAKGDTSPIDLVKDDIIEIIINNRKRDKYIQIKKKLINDAVKSGLVTLK